ncbi:MAG: SH3 domain-containing protein, partial [Clostridia bacterium]|nr:SH3 domain-containing protein [Clostridia bacterium]
MNGYGKTLKRLAAALLAAMLLLLNAAPAMAETFSAVVTAKSMAVYGEASMSRQLGTLEKNTVVRVIGYSTKVAKISYNGNTGYAKISDMKRVDDLAQKAVLNAAAPVYKAPQTDSASVKAPAGTRLYVLAESGEWAMVEKNGVVGYVKGEYLTEADENWSTPAATPTAAASITENGITVRSFDAVALEKTKVYQSASAKAKSLGTLKAGAQVTVKATSSDGWAYIEANGKRGYCKLSSLKEGAASATLAPEPTATVPQGQSATVTSKKLTVYKTASSKGKKLGTLKKGQIVNLLETNNGWAYIELKGNYGYCAAKGLSTDDSGVPSGFKQAGFSATVISAEAKVYASTNTDAENASIKLGAEVQVYAYNDSWACVVENGKYGFIPVKLLSKASYATIDGDGSALQTLLKALL